MTRRFWIVTMVWVVAIVAGAPFFIELLDEAGLGFQIPGLSVTAGEVLLVALVAGLPPLLAGWIIRRGARVA